MSDLSNLEGEELLAIIAMHKQTLADIERDINTLADKKARTLARIAELSTYLPCLPPTNVSAYIIPSKRNPTFSDKVQFVLDIEAPEMSTGEIYEALIAYYPEEKEKDKTMVIENISRELGKNAKEGILYYKSDNKDANGKTRFGLLTPTPRK